MLTNSRAHTGGRGRGGRPRAAAAAAAAASRSRAWSCAATAPFGLTCGRSTPALRDRSPRRARPCRCCSSRRCRRRAGSRSAAVHWLERDGERTPLDETEYARDSGFAYDSSPAARVGRGAQRRPLRGRRRPRDRARRAAGDRRRRRGRATLAAAASGRPAGRRGPRRRDRRRPRTIARRPAPGAGARRGASSSAAPRLRRASSPAPRARARWRSASCRPRPVLVVVRLPRPAQYSAQLAALSSAAPDALGRGPTPPRWPAPARRARRRDRPRARGPARGRAAWRSSRPPRSRDRAATARSRGCGSRVALATVVAGAPRPSRRRCSPRAESPRRSTSATDCTPSASRSSGRSPRGVSLWSVDRQSEGRPVPGDRLPRQRRRASRRSPISSTGDRRPA